MRLSFQSHVWVSRERKKGHARGFCYPHPSLRSLTLAGYTVTGASVDVFLGVADWSLFLCPGPLIGRLVIVLAFWLAEHAVLAFWLAEHAVLAFWLAEHAVLAFWLAEHAVLAFWLADWLLSSHFDWTTGYSFAVLVFWLGFSCELCLYFLYLRHISAYLSVCTQWWSIFALTLSVLIPLFRTYDVITCIVSPCKFASYLCVLWIIINRARVYRPQPCLDTLPYPLDFSPIFDSLYPIAFCLFSPVVGSVLWSLFVDA